MDMLEEDIDAETGEEYQYNPKWDVDPCSENLWARELNRLYTS